MLKPFGGTAERGKTFRATTPGQVLNPTGEYQYLIRPFTIDLNMSYYQVSDEELKRSDHHRFRVSILISTVALEVFPELVNDLANLMSYMEGHMITPMLKKYRPPMRPYTQEIGS